jgi:hypothetical protein
MTNDSTQGQRSLRRLLGLGLLAGTVLQFGCGSSTDTASGTSDTGNLILNPGAESAKGSADGEPVKTPDWTSKGEATAATYGDNGWPEETDPGPPKRGKNFFSGGPDEMDSTLTQSIDVSQYGSSIDGGGVTYVLSGWLGGFSGQTDHATVTATFLGSSGESVGTGTIGPVTAAERKDSSGLLEKTEKGTVPSGTRSVKVVIDMVREDGAANDGYADELSLVFDGV